MSLVIQLNAGYTRAQLAESLFVMIMALQPARVPRRLWTLFSRINLKRSFP
jgi:hypothetical protein